jgi:hypothetical protein
MLAGASGTHAVCVCTIHYNVKHSSDVQLYDPAEKQAKNYEWPKLCAICQV